MTKNSFPTETERRILWGLFTLGVLGAAVGLWTDRTLFWPNFLVVTFYFLTLALGGAVFVAVQHLSNAGWSTVIRRIPEAMMSYLPIGAIALLLTFFGRHPIYKWTSAAVVKANPALQSKSLFLNTPSFFVRMIVILAVWIAFSWKLTRESRQQDEDGQLKHTGKSKKYSAIFLAFFAITFSLASFDWIMSVQPEFYSTIFAFYCFSGLFLTGVAAVTLLTLVLRNRGLLPQVNENHLHNLGKLIFAFSTFWAYLWICQFLLVYYTNLPDETIFYIRQTATPGWKALFLLNLFLNWIFPFVLLLSRNAKRQQGPLITVSVILLLGHWVDLYTTVLPAYGDPPRIGFVELSLWAGFSALFLLIFKNAIGKASLVPKNDPYLEESLTMHSDEWVTSAAIWRKDSKRALALSTVAFAISFAVWGLLSALAPRFREMYHLTVVQTSLMIAVPVLLGSIGRIPLGILADRFGGRVVFGLLLISCFIPTFGVSFSHSYRALIAWGFLIGFAGTSFSVGVAFASKWFEAKYQGAALGIYGMGNIGQSVAMFAAPAMVVASGKWELPFQVFGIVAALYGLVFLIFARNATVRVKPKRFGESLAVLKREPLAWVLSLFYFLTFGGFVALSIYLPTLLKDIFGLTLTNAGARVAGFVLVATLLRPVGGWLADRFGGAQVLSLVLALISISALGMTSNSMVIFTVGALGTAALLGTGNGAVFKLVPEYFPRETGTVTGLVGAAGGLGGFFPPLVLGVIRSHTNSYTPGFILLSVFALLCLLINFLVFLRTRREADILSATD